jgi:hypothetical protein
MVSGHSATAITLWRGTPSETLLNIAVSEKSASEIRRGETAGRCEVRCSSVELLEPFSSGGPSLEVLGVIAYLDPDVIALGADAMTLGS